MAVHIIPYDFELNITQVDDEKMNEEISQFFKKNNIVGDVSSITNEIKYKVESIRGMLQLEKYNFYKNNVYKKFCLTHYVNPTINNGNKSFIYLIHIN
jgi:hypothetical protein